MHEIRLNPTAARIWVAITTFGQDYLEASVPMQMAIIGCGNRDAFSRARRELETAGYVKLLPGKGTKPIKLNIVNPVLLLINIYYCINGNTGTPTAEVIMSLVDAGRANGSALIPTSAVDPVDRQIATPVGEVGRLLVTPVGEVTTKLSNVATPVGEVGRTSSTNDLLGLATPVTEVTTKLSNVATPVGEVTTKPDNIPTQIATPVTEVSNKHSNVVTPVGEVANKPDNVVTPVGEVGRFWGSRLVDEMDNSGDIALVKSPAAQRRKKQLQEIVKEFAIALPNELPLTEDFAKRYLRLKGESAYDVVEGINDIVTRHPQLLQPRNDGVSGARTYILKVFQSEAAKETTLSSLPPSEQPAPRTVSPGEKYVPSEEYMKALNEKRAKANFPASWL